MPRNSLSNLLEGMTLSRLWDSPVKVAHVELLVNIGLIDEYRQPYIAVISVT